MKNSNLLTLILIAALLFACAPENTISPGYSLHGGLQAWVDAPLEGTILTLPVSYTLVCHGSDPFGVQALDFSIDEQVLETVPNPDPDSTLFNASTLWEPVEPGTYTVHCRAENSSGEWSEYAVSRVLVVAEIDAVSPVLTILPTPTPTATSTPTLTPTTALTFTSQVSTYIFEYQHDCVPNPAQVTIIAMLSSTADVESVYLFFRLESGELGVTTEWNTGVVMSKGTSGYSTTIAWDVIPQLSQVKWSSAVFAYQFVVVDQNEVILARSQVFRDITLRPCE